MASKMEHSLLIDSPRQLWKGIGMRSVASLAIVLLIASTALSGDSEEFEKKKAEHAKTLEEVKKDLDVAFEKRIELAGKKKGATPEERLKVVESLQREKDKCASSNCIPFSPQMRDEAIRYLERVNRSATVLAKAYDRQIARATNDNEIELTKSLMNQKQALAVVVGTWECQGTNFRGNFTWTLYSDFSINRANANENFPKGWAFQPNGGMLIKNFSPGAPKGGYNDKCTISRDGQLLEAKNQFGGVYIGSLK
jgi:hypothetical protein